MHHVSSGRDSNQFAVRNISMKMLSLLEFDNAIFSTCNNSHRHLQPSVFLAKDMGGRIINAVSAALARI